MYVLRLYDIAGAKGVVMTARDILRRRGRKRIQRRALAVLAGALLASVAASASAAADSAPVASADQGDGVSVASNGATTNEVEQITVTARRRSENAQNVPISLTAITGDTLAANGITNALKLQQVIPSLQVVSFNPRNTNLIIRGLGANIAVVNDGIEPGVGVYVDGVFYARPAETVFDLPDIQTLEELRGPQGTLYGKNTVAGAINITTEAPDGTFVARGEVSEGDYGYQKYSATVSGPIDDISSKKIVP